MTETTTPHQEPLVRRLLRRMFPNLEPLACEMEMPLEELLDWASALPILNLIQAGRTLSDVIAQAAISGARTLAAGKLREMIEKLKPGETLRRACKDVIQHNIVEPAKIDDAPTTKPTDPSWDGKAPDSLRDDDDEGPPAPRGQQPQPGVGPAPRDYPGGSPRDRGDNPEGVAAQRQGHNPFGVDGVVHPIDRCAEGCTHCPGHTPRPPPG